MSDKADEKSSIQEAKEKCVHKSRTLAKVPDEMWNKKSSISAKGLEGNSDKKYPTPPKAPEERKDPIYSFYRVSSNGNPQIIIQSEGCCMLDKAGVMTKETVRTVQSEMGTTMARNIITSKNLHFHVDMALMNKAKQQIPLQATKSKSVPSNPEDGGTEKKTDEK